MQEIEVSFIYVNKDKYGDTRQYHFIVKSDIEIKDKMLYVYGEYNDYKKHVVLLSPKIISKENRIAGTMVTLEFDNWIGLSYKPTKDDILKELV